MLVKFINFLNAKPKLNFKLAHLYKFKRYNCYNKNSLISPNYFVHLPLKQTLGLDAGLIRRKKCLFFISRRALSSSGKVRSYLLSACLTSTDPVAQQS